MWTQEEKLKILAAICASLPVTTEEAAGVLRPDAMIINLATISSQGEPGTSIVGVTPQGPGFLKALPPPSHQITPEFLHSLALPADCLSDSDQDSLSNTETGSGSPNNSNRELSEVHPPSSDFQGVSQNPSLRVMYRNMVPVTKLFTSCLHITEVDRKHLANFIQEQDIPWSLCPEHKKFRPAEESASTKDYNCLTIALANKE